MSKGKIGFRGNGVGWVGSSIQGRGKGERRGEMGKFFL